MADKENATYAITPGFHRHLVWSTIGQVLVVTLALATESIAPWPAALLITTALALGAHWLECRRGPGKGPTDSRQGVARRRGWMP